MSRLRTGKTYRVRYACDGIGAVEIEGILDVIAEEGIIIEKKIAIHVDDIISIDRLKDGTEDIYNY